MKNAITVIIGLIITTLLFGTIEQKAYIISYSIMILGIYLPIKELLKSHQ